jgi:hypothetical protein
MFRSMLVMILTSGLFCIGPEPAFAVKEGKQALKVVKIEYGPGHIGHQCQADVWQASILLQNVSDRSTTAHNPSHRHEAMIQGFVSKCPARRWDECDLKSLWYWTPVIPPGGLGWVMLCGSLRHGDKSFGVKNTTDDFDTDHPNDQTQKLVRYGVDLNKMNEACVERSFAGVGTQKVKIVGMKFDYAPPTELRRKVTIKFQNLTPERQQVLFAMSQRGKHGDLLPVGGGAQPVTIEAGRMINVDKTVDLLPGTREFMVVIMGGGTIPASHTVCYPEIPVPANIPQNPD